jgi:putative transposase
MPNRLTWYMAMSIGVLRDRMRRWTRPSTRPVQGSLLDRFRSREELVRENALLRKQLEVACRQIRRPRLTRTDRAMLVLLARLAPTWRSATLLVQPETILRWHRRGFRLIWRWRSHQTGAPPRISPATIALIKQMARNNRLWGAERIRGELLKLDIRVAKRTIQKYMRRVAAPRPPSQRWATFLRNHARETWACDFL